MLRAFHALALAASLAASSAAAELRVGAAASLWEPAREIARAYEAAGGERVRLVYGASSQLAAQIRAGAPLDVLLSADAAIVDALALERRVDPASARLFARNGLVVLAAPGVVLAGPEALRGDALRRFALPHAAVPLGRYARAWLAEAGLLEALSPRIVQTEHARATLAAIELGHADAGVVYATDARQARRATLAFVVRAAAHPAVRYVAAALSRSPRPAAARRFLAFLGAPEAIAALERAGFAAAGPGS